MKNELSQAINKVKSIVPKNNQNSVLQGLLVNDGYLIASNTELMIKIKLSAGENEKFVIPARAFDLILNLPNEEIELKSNINEVLISATSIKNKYQTVDPETFPQPKMSDNINEIALSGEKLYESLKRTIFAASKKENNLIAAAIDFSADKGYLNITGLDGHVVAWDKIIYDGGFELLIPRYAVEKLLALGITGEVTIKYSKTGALIKTKDYELYTRLVSGQYFQYQKMFKELPLHTVVNRIAFLEAMNRAKMCIVDKGHVRIILNGTQMKVTVKNMNTDYSEIVELQEEMSEELVIGFDARLVTETLKAFDCENIGIQFQSPKYPMIVEAEDSEFRALVLPVTLRE